MPANRHLGRSASQVAFRKARAEMAELYHKGYHPNDIIRLVIEKISSMVDEIRAPLLVDMSRAVLFHCHRPGIPNMKEMKANKDFAAADDWEA